MSHVPTVSLTSVSYFVALEVLAAQAFVQVGTHADTLSVQQSESASVMTWLTLAQVILCHIVCRGLPQVRDPGVSVRHVQRNKRIDGLWLSETTECVRCFTFRNMMTEELYHIIFHLQQD